MTSELRPYVKRKSITKRDLCFFDMEKLLHITGEEKEWMITKRKERNQEQNSKG